MAIILGRENGGEIFIGGCDRGALSLPKSIRIALTSKQAQTQFRLHLSFFESDEGSRTSGGSQA